MWVAAAQSIGEKEQVVGTGCPAVHCRHQLLMVHCHQVAPEWCRSHACVENGPGCAYAHAEYAPGSTLYLGGGVRCTRGRRHEARVQAGTSMARQLMLTTVHRHRLQQSAHAWACNGRIVQQSPR
jgi:hypothetical protein